MAINQFSSQRVDGPVGVSVANTDLISGVVNGAYDVSGWGGCSIQVIGTVGIASGAINIECSNDGVNFVNQAHQEPNITTGALGGGAFTIAASTARIFQMSLSTKWLRCRVSTAFSGGTVSAVVLLSEKPMTHAALAVRANANLLSTVTPTVGTVHVLTSAASTNATSVKTTAGPVFTLNLTNYSATPKFFKLYQKASAPTVGTDIPILTIPIAATAFLPMEFGALGLQVSAGIAYAITNLITDADVTAVAAGDVKVAMTYL